MTPLLTDGGHLQVDQDRTGRVTTTQLIEQSGNANFRLMLDLNSTLKDGAKFNFLTETRNQNDPTERPFTFSDNDLSGSSLSDTSYVINSAASTICSNSSPDCAGGQQTVVVTFSRANNEYITKSFTSNHPSNDAALKLGTIAAQGLALGDMQTALTRLDINDFGYGNNEKNLAVQVKRLAPIANNSFLIASTDALKLATDAIDYRIAARRGNWSGFSDAKHSFWLKGLGAQSNSSGSVPLTKPGAQDTAGHDGFRTSASGVVMGFDKVIDNATYGVSYANVGTSIRQADDRNGESSRLQQHIWSLYAQRTDGPYFISGTVRYADGRVNGLRRTAIDRIADFDFSTNNTEVSVKTGQRFDSSNGRSAFTPYVKGTGGFYKQSAYEETGAGALSLNVAEQRIQRMSAEAGLSISHKGRFSGVKALTVMDVAVGKDLSISDQTIHARYTGETHTSHAAFTAFTTPAEQWSSNYVNLKMNLQLEVANRAMFKLGAAAELRQGRQRFGTDISMNWVF
jgi:outer membrane autotransporter protein